MDCHFTGLSLDCNHENFIAFRWSNDRFGQNSYFYRFARSRNPLPGPGRAKQPPTGFLCNLSLEDKRTYLLDEDFFGFWLEVMSHFIINWPHTSTALLSTLFSFNCRVFLFTTKTVSVSQADFHCDELSVCPLEAFAVLWRGSLVTLSRTTLTSTG